MSDPTSIELAFRGRRIAVEVLRTVDGRGRAVEREVVRHPGAVLIVPVLDEHTVLLIRNRRIAVDDTLWEFPAGTLEAGEPPAACAARELVEETGHRAARLDPLGSFYTSPGITDERMHVFVATDLTPGPPALEPGEDIEVHRMSVDALLALIDDGALVDAKTIAAALLWRRRVDART
ncbi:MAG: NUDIX hydrolase [Phycisphaerales bacterium]|nr:NUDIX hydrolase [Phycisphaerales bacterium]